MSEIKKCKQCKDAGELSSEDIPKWSKKEGNYSPYPEMITCDEKYNLKESDSLVEINPDINDRGVEIELEFGKEEQNSWIFFWASDETEDKLITLRI